MERTIQKKAIWVMIAAMLLTAVFSISTAQTVYGANFNDISDHWANGEIQAAVNRGYINGYSDGSFKPDNPISRAEFVKIINSAKNFTTVTNIAFKDVFTSEWYYPEVQKAVAAGYITGYGTTFGPNNQITREEVAVIINRIAPGNTNASLSGVTDQAQISDWALESVKASYSNGYLSGFPDGKFYPQAPLKRGEAVKIINKVLGVQAVDTTKLEVTSLSISDITEAEATVKMQSSKSGSMYWVLIEDKDSKTPSAERVYNGKDNDNATPADRGSFNTNGNTSHTVSLKKLSSEESYKFCVVARDSNGNLSAVKTDTFTTKTEGDTGENWITEFKSGSVGDTSLKVTVKTNKKGTLYWVLDENSNTNTPSQSNIKKGKLKDGTSAYRDDSFSISANTTESFDISSLKAGTNYKLYAVLYESSSSSSKYSIVKTISFKTTGTDTNWLTTFTTNNVDSTSFTLKAKSNTAGTLYWIVTENSSTPTTAQIKDGKDKSGSAAVSKGNASVKVNTEYTNNITGLKESTKYYVFGCVLNGSTYSTIDNANFTTSTSTQYVNNLDSFIITYDGGPSNILSFAPGKYDYTANVITVPNGTSKLKVSASADAEVLTLNKQSYGKSFTDEELTMPATPGTKFSIVVEVAQSGKTKRTYKVDVIEAAPVLTKISVPTAATNVITNPKDTELFTVPTGEVNTYMNIEYPTGMTAEVKVGDSTIDKDETGYKIPLVTGTTAVKVTITGANGSKAYTVNIKNN